MGLYNWRTQAGISAELVVSTATVFLSMSVAIASGGYDFCAMALGCLISAFYFLPALRKGTEAALATVNIFGVGFMIAGGVAPVEMSSLIAAMIVAVWAQLVWEKRNQLLITRPPIDTQIGVYRGKAVLIHDVRYHAWRRPTAMVGEDFRVAPLSSLSACTADHAGDVERLSEKTRRPVSGAVQLP